MSKFRKVEMTARRGNGYGQYVVEATYKGKQVKAHTTDSEIFDWLHDDSNKEKHQEAKRAAYLLICHEREAMCEQDLYLAWFKQH